MYAQQPIQPEGGVKHRYARRQQQSEHGHVRSKQAGQLAGRERRLGAAVDGGLGDPPLGHDRTQADPGERGETVDPARSPAGLWSGPCHGASSVAHKGEPGRRHPVPDRGADPAITHPG